MMRTTVDISEEAYHAVKAIARDREESLGKVMSELILKGINGSPHKIGELRMVDGWPLISYGKVVTSEDVRKILEEVE